MLRLFVGLELPASLHPEITLIQSGLPNARWIAPENLHLTLHFFGEVDEYVAEDFDAVLGGLEHPSFELTLAALVSRETGI